MEQELLNDLIKHADHLYTQGQMEQAREAYEEILAQNETVAWAHSRIGAILAQSGDTEKAESAFLKALELDPQLPQAHSNLGNLYYARGDYEIALSKYKEAVALNPANPLFHENLHAAYKKLGKYGEAVSALKQANRLGRENAKAEAKAKFDEVKANIKGRSGCFGTSLITILAALLIIATVV